MTTYAIEITYEDRMPTSVALAARNDAQAEKALRKYISCAKLPADALVFLSYFRESDGQHGYLNPDGASPTAKPWSTRKALYA